MGAQGPPYGAQGGGPGPLISRKKFAPQREPPKNQGAQGPPKNQVAQGPPNNQGPKAPSLAGGPYIKKGPIPERRRNFTAASGPARTFRTRAVRSRPKPRAPLSQGGPSPGPQPPKKAILNRGALGPHFILFYNSFNDFYIQIYYFSWFLVKFISKYIIFNYFNEIYAILNRFYQFLQDFNQILKDSIPGPDFSRPPVSKNTPGTKN